MSELLSWERPHLQDGGYNAQIFYAVFGDFKAPLPPLSRSKYRTNGAPAEVAVMGYNESSHPEVRDELRTGYLWDSWAAENVELSQQVLRAPSCIVLNGEVASTSDLNYLRDCVGLITHLLDSGGYAVYDPQMARWWSAAEWRESVFAPGNPSPGQHVMILCSEEENGSGRWFHTRGLRKFGRPDLSIHHVPADLERAIIEMFNRFIEFTALGGIITDGHPIKMAGLPDGMSCRLGGHLDDPDFNNKHGEIHWPQA